jgi:chromate transporter
VAASADLWALALSVAAILAIFRFKTGMMWTLAGACAAGMVLFSLGFLS